MDFQKLKQEVETHLVSSLQDIERSTIRQAMEYSLLIGGKRLRPMLLLAALHDYGYDYMKALDIACALEMVHTYSLIHDDLPAMDDDELRRGKPTCHIQFDEATAILAGDALLTHAFSRIVNSNQPASVKCLIVAELANASGPNGMILGQHYDLTAERRMDVTEQEIVNIDLLKTGKLITLPLRLAVMIAFQGKEDEPGYHEELDIMTKLGEELGIAFQIQDDVLDVLSTPEILGKPINSDKKQGKSTYVSLLGIEGAQIEAKRRFENVFALAGKRTAKDSQLVALLETIWQRNY